MWYYHRVKGEQLYTVAFCTGVGDELDHPTDGDYEKEEAARRCNYLNGGTGLAFPRGRRVPKPTDQCVCKVPPGRVDGLGEPSNAMLDHRCRLHGNAAQPEVWGMHTGDHLIVEPQEWERLHA